MHTFKTDKDTKFTLGTLAEFLAKIEEPAIRAGYSSTDIKWSGGITRAEAVRRCQEGDLSDVARSEALLDKLDIIPAPTARHELIDDVVGAMPNVPAFLAGQPLAMRRKVKRDNEHAPIAIVVNLAASAMIKADDMHKRGVAVLALVRAISARRPIELWVGSTSTIRSYDGTGHVYFRIDTTPMDLARAAFLIAHPAVPRHLLYSLNIWQGASPSVPLGPSIQRESWMRSIKAGFAHMSDVLAIPVLMGGDPLLTDPAAWIREHVKAYTESELEADEAA